MRVVELWRYPVKSLQGEQLDSTAIEPDGVAGDRQWAVRDVETGKILTGRRDPVLLTASARLVDGVPVLTLPDGTEVTGDGPDADEALSAWIGRPVQLLARDERHGPAEIEMYADGADETSEVLSWSLPASRFVDVEPLLLVTTASLRAGEALHGDGQWVSRRFRPNVLIDADGDGWVEDGWKGQAITLGAVQLMGTHPCPRCTMVIRQQPGGIVHDTTVLKVLTREHSANFGLWASVTTPGRVSVGDDVQVDVASGH